MMANKQEHRIHAGDRVRIKDTATHMYRYARAHNEGTVKAISHDDMGYPHIFVEWDKDHWAYSGEEDGWTFEAHFDLVKEKMSDKQEDFINALEALMKQFKQPESEPKDVKEKRSREDRDELTYDQVLNRAVDEAIDGEAFIILVAKPDEFDGSVLLAPHIFVHSKREDAALMLQAAMADLAAQTHLNLVMDTIERARRNGSTGS